MTSWCHGAAGILLSRVKCYDEMYLEEFLTKDIENAIKAIIRHGMFDNNCLCHGNLGNSEISDFQVFDDTGKEYQYQDRWLTSESFENKAYKCGINMEMRLNCVGEFQTMDIELMC